MNEVPNIALLWTDLETTGLNYDSDLILEMAWQMTDYLGNPLHPAQSYITISYGDDGLMAEVLNKYRNGNEYVRQMHLKNMLWNEVLFDDRARRNNFFSVIEALHEDLDQLRGDAEVRLAGSTVGFDKRFIETVYGEELPISHRVHDLSTLRPFMKWQGFDLSEFTSDVNNDSHRALDDVQRDIQQWQGLVGVLTEET